MQYSKLPSVIAPLWYRKSYHSAKSYEIMLVWIPTCFLVPNPNYIRSCARGIFYSFCIKTYYKMQKKKRHAQISTGLAWHALAIFQRIDFSSFFCLRIGEPNLQYMIHAHPNEFWSMVVNFRLFGNSFPMVFFKTSKMFSREEMKPCLETINALFRQNMPSEEFSIILWIFASHFILFFCKGIKRNWDVNSYKKKQLPYMFSFPFYRNGLRWVSKEKSDYDRGPKFAVKILVSKN